MIPIFTLLVLGIARAQTCTRGDTGADGASVEITVDTIDHTSCYSQTVQLGGQLVTNIVRCNGTDGAPGVSTTIAIGTGVNLGAALFVDSGGLAAAQTVFNGSVGAKGAQGAQGPQGNMGTSVWPTITTVGAPTGCINVIANGSVPWCNATIGLTGNQGPQGFQGLPGNNGVIGLTGVTGSTGSLLPNTLIVDGVSNNFPYSFLGVQQALCQAGCGSRDCTTCSTVSQTGTVYIGANCGILNQPCTNGPQTLIQDSTTVLFVPSGVTLDLGGNTLQAPASGCGGSQQSTNPLIAVTFWNTVLTGPQQSTTNSLTAASTLGEGSLIVTVPANSILTTGLAVGQYCVVSSLRVDANADPGNLQTKLLGFNNATGVMSLADPIPGIWVSGTSQVTCSTNYVVGATVRNGLLSAGGSTCSNVNWHAMTILGTDRFTLADMRFTGSLSNGASMDYLSIFKVYASSFERLRFFNAGVFSSSFNAGHMAACDLVDIRSAGSTFGSTFSLGSSFYNSFDTLVLDSSGNAGMSMFFTSYNTFNNILVSRAEVAQGATSFAGIAFSGASRHNIFHNVQVLGLGSTNRAMQWFTGQNSYNQVFGFIEHYIDQGQRSIGFSDATSPGNFVEGEIDSPANFPGNGDFWFANAFRSNTGVSGHAFFTVRNTTMARSDFPATRMCAFNAITDRSFGVGCVGADGVLRQAATQFTS